MSARIPLSVDQQFDKWIIVDPTYIHRRGNRYVLCQCECGTVQQVAVSHLAHGRSRGCRSCSGKEVAVKRIWPKPTHKTCRQCGLIKEVGQFQKQRRLCKACDKEKEKQEWAKRIATEEEKFCTRCQKTKPLKYFDMKGSLCQMCRRARATEQRNARTTEQREQTAADQRTFYLNNKERIRHQQRILSRVYIWNRRCLVINHYGGKCACCGETQMHFLEIDHINGGGNAHRRQLRKKNLYEWLIKQGFPKGFRVLCSNCNKCIGVYGFCPHQGVGPQLPLFWEEGVTPTSQAI